MADKDVEVTEPAAGPADEAQDPQPLAAAAQDAQHPAAAAQDAQHPASAEPTTGTAAGTEPTAGTTAGTEPTAGTAAEAPAEEPAGPAAGAGSPPGGRRAWRTAAALGVATVVLAGFGVWATLHASSLRANAAAQNTALTDGPATAAVRRDISAAVNTIFSYSYAHTAATKQAAQRLLTGPAVRQYNTLFALVTKNAPAQKLVVTTRVTNIGVELLTGNRARLLVFANQQDTRAGTGQTSYAGAMFAVTALRQGGRWKIENIDTFGG